MRPSTEQTYQKKLDRYKTMLTHPPEDVYKYLVSQGLQPGYIKNVLCAFKWSTGNNAYSKLIQDLAQEITSTTNPNTNRFKKLSWPVLPKPAGTSVTDVVIGLYTMFPPRRLSDYAYMSYIETESENISTEINYYVNTTDTFIFQNYKTVGKFGNQRFTVSDESESLTKLLRTYIIKNDIKPGTSLLGYKTVTSEMNKKSLGRKLTKIFGTSVDGLRHSYITYRYQDTLNLYTIDATSAKMAHNITTHLRYLDKENKKTEK